MNTFIMTADRVYDANHGGIWRRPPQNTSLCSLQALCTSFLCAKALSLQDLKKMLVFHLGRAGEVGGLSPWGVWESKNSNKRHLPVGASEGRQHRSAARVSYTVAIASLLPSTSHTNIPRMAVPVGNGQGRELWVMQFGLVKLILIQLPF